MNEERRGRERAGKSGDTQGNGIKKSWKLPSRAAPSYVQINTLPGGFFPARGAERRWQLLLGEGEAISLAK